MLVFDSVLPAILSVLMWADIKNIYIIFTLYILISFGFLGAIDDYKKIKNNNSVGVSFKFKLLTQIIISLVGISFLTYYLDYQEFTNLYFPFFKDLFLNLGWFFIPFALFVIIGSSNAVNLTDGLDGLATVPVILVAACLAFISYSVAC